MGDGKGVETLNCIYFKYRLETKQKKGAEKKEVFESAFYYDERLCLVFLLCGNRITDHLKADSFEMCRSKYISVAY